MQLSRNYKTQTPPNFWEMWVKATEYAPRGQTGDVGDVFWYAHRQVESSALAAVRLEYHADLSYVAPVCDGTSHRRSGSR